MGPKNYEDNSIKELIVLNNEMSAKETVEIFELIIEKKSTANYLSHASHASHASEKQEI